MPNAALVALLTEAAAHADTSAGLDESMGAVQWAEESRALATRLRTAADALAGEARDGAAGPWHEGAPPKPWSEEWFLARTTFGDVVALRALPEEYAYDFKTADDTYIKRDRITHWAQLSTSEFVAYANADAARAATEGNK